MKSKEDNILEQFFNTPKYWHFEDLRREAHIGRPQLARWLNIFEEQKIIKRIRKKGK